jgi:hypothetical protein
MDTLRDRQELESLFQRGPAPWAVWANSAPDLRLDLFPSERILT